MHKKATETDGSRGRLPSVFFCLYMIFKAMIAETGGEWVTVGKQKGRSEFCNEKCVFRFPPEGGQQKTNHCKILLKLLADCHQKPPPF